MDYYYPMCGADWGWGIGLSLLGLFVIAVVVVLVVRLFPGGDRGASPQNEPLEIAKSRYAKGEITREEFTQLTKDLAR